MRLVGFDTATDDTVVAGQYDGDTVFELTVGPGSDGRPRHSQALLEAANRAAEALGGWQQVDRIAVGVGPGTFTGLRIGIATATGLALSAGLELAAVPTLDALARDLLAGAAAAGPVVPMLDARRGELFLAVYDESGREREAAAALAPEAAADLVRGIGPSAMVGGPGAVRFAELFDRAGIGIVDPESEGGHLTGHAICELGAVVAACAPGQPLKPIYIRAPDAQLWLERDAPPKR